MAEASPLLQQQQNAAQHTGKAFQKGGQFDVSNGPATHRRCTDVCFLLLLVLACTAYGFTKMLAWKNGRPALLTGAVDWKGRVCGVDEGVKDHPFLYFPTTHTPTAASLFMLKPEQLIPVCTSKCPEQFQETRAECSAEDVKRGYCSWYGGETKVVFQKFCLFKMITEFDASSFPGMDQDFCYTEKATGKSVCASVQDASELKQLGITRFKEFVHDVAEAKHALYWAPVATVVAGYLYLIAVQQCTFIFVWTGVLGITFGPLCGAAVMYTIAQATVVEEEKKNAMIVVYCLVGCSVFFGLLVCCFLRSIRVAIAVLEVAAKFCRDVVSAWVLPIIFTLFNTALLLTWTAGFGLQLTTLKVKEISNLTQSLDRFDVPDDSYYYFLAFDVFMLLWLFNFFAALADMTIAGAVGYWYFTPMDSNGNKSPSAPVLRAMLNAFFWHGGSAAFGSLLIAFLSFVRLILQAINMAAQKQSSATEANAAAARMVTCCLECVFGCIERVLKFVTNIAYVQVALLGHDFCESAGVAVGLWARNAVRFAFVNDLSGVISFVGVFVIAQAPVATVFLLLTRHEAFVNSVTNPYSASIAAGLFGVVVASCVMKVFSEACEAVLQCYLADEEMALHCGLPEAEHTPHVLRKFIDVHASHKGHV